MDFLFFPRHFPASFGAGEDRVHVKKEERYEQAKRYQTAVEGNATASKQLFCKGSPSALSGK